jgi:hypothetical protein
MLMNGYMISLNQLGTEGVVTRTTTFSPSSITVDGNLSAGEWDDAEQAIQWYMDADPENYDGFNYMYLDEDIDNLYIALDLVSDQTNDVSDEWVGLWLNTNETFVEDDNWQNATIKWEAALNNGLESLLYDVDNDREMPFFDPDGTGREGYWDLNSLNDLTAINGSFAGSLVDLESASDLKSANMTSEFTEAGYVYRLDVTITISDYWQIFSELFTNHTSWVEIGVRTLNNETLGAHYLTIRDPSGTLDLGNPNKTVSINTGTSWVTDTLNVTSGNFTQDNEVLLSLVGMHQSHFKTSIDQIWIHMRANDTYDGGMYYMVNEPYTSINNYEIDWTFGPSENNATDHRSFEVKIPKSELEGYDDDKKLGILVGGYGTLISWPNTHNWVLANGTDTDLPYRNTTAYNYYSMPMKGWTPLTNPVLDTITPNPDTDGNVLVNWNDDPGAENWTLYRHSSEITALNLDTAVEVVSGLTESQHNDTGLANGTYWYATVAMDSLGYSYLSNSEDVTVEIPAPVTTTTTTTTTPTTTTTTTTTTDTTTSGTTTPPPDGGDTTLYLIVAGVGAAGVVIVIVIVVIRKR